MGKNIFKILKVITIVCIVILIIELIYICFFLEKKSIYFDGINSVIEFDKGLVAVGSNNNNEQHFEKAKITRYNSKKEKSFERIYNKGYNGVFYNVVSDSSDNLVAVGSYEATKEEHGKGIRTALIVKYDKDGNLLYEADFQLLGNSKYTSIVEVEDGYIVTGQSIYEDMVVGLSEDGGAYIAKYSKELDVLWMKNFGDSKNAVFNDLTICNDKIYVVGKSDSITSVIARYDLDGKLEKYVESENSDDFGFSDVVEFDNKLFVSGGIINREKNDSDAIVLQYDLSLNKEKEEIYDDGGNDRFNQLVVDEIGNVVLIGTTAIVDENKSEEKNVVFEHNGVVAKYDKNLDKVMILAYGDDRDDYFTDIIVYNDSYLISGYSSYEDGSYLSKFITYSYALKILGVE